MYALHMSAYPLNPNMLGQASQVDAVLGYMRANELGCGTQITVAMTVWKQKKSVPKAKDWQRKKKEYLTGTTESKSPE